MTLDNSFNSDLDEFILVTLQPSATRQVWSEEAENFSLTSWYMYLLEAHGNFQSEVILFWGQRLPEIVWEVVSSKLNTVCNL